MRQSKTLSGLTSEAKGDLRGAPEIAIVILVVGVASTALYLITQETQQAISRNGLRANPLLIDPGYPADPSVLLWQYGLYFLSTLGLFALYGFVLFRSHRGDLDRGAVRALALALPVLFNLLLLPGVPHLSQDILSYMAHGYLEVLPYRESVPLARFGGWRHCAWPAAGGLRLAPRDRNRNHSLRRALDATRDGGDGRCRRRSDGVAAPQDPCGGGELCDRASHLVFFGKNEPPLPNVRHADVSLEPTGRGGVRG